MRCREMERDRRSRISGTKKNWEKKSMHQLKGTGTEKEQKEETREKGKLINSVNRETRNRIRKKKKQKKRLMQTVRKLFYQQSPRTQRK